LGACSVSPTSTGPSLDLNAVLGDVTEIVTDALETNAAFDSTSGRSLRSKSARSS
jgi:hypothetical protein